MGTKVYLNVYDLTPANDYLYPIGFGLHHSGVEILGSEYSFASGAGIFYGRPKDVPNAVFREKIEMGVLEGGSAEVRMALSSLKDDGFGSDDYHLLRRNCNHFANALCWKLLNKTIPPHINRLAEIGLCCSYFLPKSLLEHAPVGDTTTSASNNATGGGALRRKQQQASNVFSGTGSRLGGMATTSDNNKEETTGLLSMFNSTIAAVTSSTVGSTSTNSSSRTTPVDELTDRREKARKAALARLERNQQQANSTKQS